MADQHDNAAEHPHTGGNGDSPSRNHGVDPIVRLEHVTKSFDNHVVLDDLTLDIKRHRTTVVLGPSGTGKSVLLKHIVGLLRPDRGEVYFDGERIDQLSEHDLVAVRRKIGFLFQMGALFDSMTVEENIAFPLVEHTDLDSAQRGQRVDRGLRMVGLEGMQRKMPAELSGGQRKRVALARAISLEPSLILYDEPTTGLDPIRADVINELIVALGRQLGITSIVVTHDMNSANKIADHMVLLYDGKVVCKGDPEAFRTTDNELVQNFIHGRAEQYELEAIRRGFERVTHETTD